MSGGYSYTTLSGGPHEPMRVSVSFYLDADARVTVPGMSTGKPHLAIEHGDVSVRVCPRPGGVTAEDARFAATVAEQAAVYAAELERLHTGRDDAGAGAAGNPAA
jgi:hypothetical protein